ncbi:MAG TPA: helix-turn-helix transcriptional regulator [Beijerinckiaceae bacterium]|jgi:transcriptional regulator with XRE-family HTH domain|nr:helix-turn-helix transcriptional regulator [Beijerinckiaceae bacterium]
MKVAAVAGPKEPQPIDRHVGARIRHKRMMLGVSQEALGDALGVTFQQVQKYEKGMNRVGASRLQAIANFLEVPVSYFFDGAGGQSQRGSAGKDQVLDLIATREGIRLNRAFAAIKDARVRAKIVSMLEALAGTSDDD